MRPSVFACLVAATFLAAGDASAQTVADSAAVRRAALDYIEGWYGGDAALMERGVHPELAKRIVRADSTGTSRIQSMTAATLIEQTGRGGGNRTPMELRRKDVEILDIFEGMASVRVMSARFVDYMHLAKWNGEWKIVNVLWDFLPPSGK